MARSNRPTEVTLPVIGEHIVRTPGTCGGKPRIAGHRIKVQHVAVWHDRLGMTPEEIVAEYPTLTLADVYAALAYYHDHREEIIADLRADEELVEQMMAANPPRTRNRRQARRAPDDPVPPG